MTSDTGARSKRTPHSSVTPSPPPPPPPPAYSQPGSPRSRVPELVAAIGAAFVALAATGGVIHSWEWFSDPQRALLLGALGVGLTAVGVWMDDRTRNLGEPVITLAWAAATVLLVAAGDLALQTVPDLTDRAVTALAGGVGAVHGTGLLVTRRRNSGLQQAVVFSALVYAIGPVAWTGWGSTDLTAGWTLEGLAATVLAPVGGLFTQTVPTIAVLPTGLGLLAIGAAWAASSTRLAGQARRVAGLLGAGALGWSALTLNAAEHAIGSTAALAIVVGLLVYGVAKDNALLLVSGAVGTTVAGIRVVVAVLSGVALVIVVVGALGIAMIGAALWALRRRNSTGAGPPPTADRRSPGESIR